MMYIRWTFEYLNNAFIGLCDFSFNDIFPRRVKNHIKIREIPTKPGGGGNNESKIKCEKISCPNFSLKIVLEEM